MPESASPAATPSEIGPDDPSWPELWRHIPDPPSRVFVQGDPHCLNRPALAIVGTRRPTNRGLAVAAGLGRALAGLGWTVVSGLALGVDGAAHEGALQAGGATVAVMATGPDLIYPRAHAGLHARLLAGGCSVTEHPAGTPPLRHHFPVRNRLIAALCRGVIVVEAPLRSGAMHTARVASEYDREVFAVPGPVDLETSRGCHRLLRDGAYLVEAAGDITRVLGVPSGAPGPLQADLFAGLPQPAPGSAALWIYDRLDLDGTRRDELRQRWPGSEGTWLEGLTALELAGLIRRLPGGRVARRIWDSA